MLLPPLSVMQTVARTGEGACAWADANATSRTKPTNKPTNRIRMLSFIGDVSSLSSRLPLLAEKQPRRHTITLVLDYKAE